MVCHPPFGVRLPPTGVVAPSFGVKTPEPLGVPEGVRLPGGVREPEWVPGGVRVPDGSQTPEWFGVVAPFGEQAPVNESAVDSFREDRESYPSAMLPDRDPTVRDAEPVRKETDGLPNAASCRLGADRELRPSPNDRRGGAGAARAWP